jgi:hypothetical protein
MPIVLAIHVIEADDASYFRVYDKTVWPAFVYANATSVILTVLYDGVTYTHDITLHRGTGVSYTNLFGTSDTAYYETTPAELLFGAVPLGTTYFPDEYYEITLTVVYSAVTYSDTSYQAFLSETYLMASQLPLQIDMNDFNYEENRLQFLCIAMLQSCKWAGELGRETQFQLFIDKVKTFLDAREISGEWSI